MIDRIKVVFFKKRAAQHYIENITPFTNTNPKTGAEFYFNKNHRGFYVKLEDAKITIAGSLHKFYHKNNYDHFSRSQLKIACEEFKDIFLIENRQRNLTVVTHEFGLNLLMENSPMLYADCMKSYARRKFVDCDSVGRKPVIFGRRCNLSNFQIKIYDKYLQSIHTAPKDILEDVSNDVDTNLLRFEIVYKRLKGTKFECELEDLYSEKYLELLSMDMIYRFERIRKVRELNLSKMSHKELVWYFAGLDNKYWELTETRFPETYKKQISSYKRLQEKHKFDPDLIDELEAKIKFGVNKLISM